MPQSIAAPLLPTPATDSNRDSHAALGHPKGGHTSGKTPLFAPRVERLLRLIAEIERGDRERGAQETRS
jgi:hypothetical protein